MTDFITVADVDASLGPGWAGAGDPVLAVTMANAWLTAKIKRVVPDPVPTEIKTAGAQVAPKKRQRASCTRPHRRKCRARRFRLSPARL
ncbi:hypothetical protein QE391_001952 [Pseudomonas fluorescens]|nr:hypothetical protein [Pseudomonas fluorescens]